jgi:rod shape-determining protein MreC
LLSILLLLLGDSFRQGLSGIAVDYVYAPFFAMKHRIAASARVFEENRLLRSRLADLSLETQRLRESAAQVELLRGMLDLSPTWLAQVVPADVVTPASLGSGMMWIDVGGRRDIQIGWPVATEDGLVGKIVEIDEHLARVRTLWDQVSRVAAYDQRSRSTGIVAWTSGSNLNLTYVLPSADVLVGDTVTSSGWGGVFPKGLRIGTVAAVDTVVGESFLDVHVAPAVDPGRLELVFIVIPRPSDYDTTLPEAIP